MRKIILYIAASLDGFIARENGELYWLPAFGYSKEDYGYKKLMSDVDTLLIGRKTYDQILEFGKWPYEGKKCYVFTSKKMKEDSNVEFVSDLVGFVKKLLEEDGKDIWLVGGSEINGILLKEGLVDEIILTVIPVILGRGIPLFNKINKDIKLELSDSNKYNSGLVQVSYNVKPN